MKRLLIVCSFFLLALIVGCSSSEKSDEKYFVLIVQGEENISEKFSKFTNNEYSVVEMQYLTSLKTAKEKYPKYEIEKAPAVFIFETAGEMKKLKLKTYDIEEALRFLETKKESQ
ncbi:MULTISPECIES: hypothetical protein [Bacillaceae]|uniref:hypothetical protein n=1 Tax=Bacillaceae TaxID=186817 RepID=UPI00178099D3|nr:MULTISPECIES: hypothetical protein [Bacillaceae]MBT2681987.1 hypothetical protein [Bacillus sp. ISL-35]MBT2706271.1 hypothetical protein [Chryseobacterium sp. ISL-80]UYZ20003.1 hypothetical protein FOF60_12960 [Mesobacillus jeotgali]